MLLPTLFDRQRQVRIQQVEIDARLARLLQRWIRLFHAVNIDGVSSCAMPDLSGPDFGASPPRQSAPTRPRLDLMPARCFFDRIIRIFWPRLFWRCLRRVRSSPSFNNAAAARRRSSSFEQSSSHARWRLTACERSAWHRTSVPVGRCRSQIVEEVLLIFWPPGPVPRTKRSSTSSAPTPRAASLPRTSCSICSGNPAMALFSSGETKADDGSQTNRSKHNGLVIHRRKT